MVVKNLTYRDKVIMDATTEFGDVQFFQSQDEEGIYTDTVLAKAATWYIKAGVESTENYSGLEIIKSFKIFRKFIDEDPLDIPEINSKDNFNVCDRNSCISSMEKTRNKIKTQK